MFKRLKNFIEKTAKNVVEKVVKKVIVEPCKKIKSFVKSVVDTVKTGYKIKQAYLLAKAHLVLDGTVAEAYVDTGVKILIAVVIGALLLAGLYALFGDTIMPTVTEKIEELFDYAG